VIVKPGSGYQAKANEEVVVSPTLKGVVLMRYIVTNRNDAAELLRAEEDQKKSSIQTVEKD